MTREDKVSELTRRIAQNGWSSIYSFVDRHATDDELDEMDVNEENEEEED